MKVKFHTQYSELAKKIENIETTKSNEINVIIFGYEERLHKMEERLNATEAESRKIRDRAAADVVLYQKKVLALEQQYNIMIQEKDKSVPSPLPPNSIQGFIPGTNRRKSFQYHVPSNINQSQPSRFPLRSVLKKTSDYKSVQSLSDKENVLPPPGEFNNHEFTGAGEGTHAEYSTAQICADASSNSVTMSVSTSVSAGDSNVGTTSSVVPQLQFVTEPPDLDTATNIPLNSDSNSSTRGKRTRFAAAKKRKLFSSRAQDTL